MRNKKNIYYGKQFIDQNDIKYVSKSLKKDLLTQGEENLKLENKIKKLTNSKYCSLTSNGTASLYLVGKALNWNKKSIVICPTISFVSTANCIELNNASTHFMDINPKTFCIDVNKLEDEIKKIYYNKKKIHSVIAVDYAGHPCEWSDLYYLSKKFNFSLVNDNCHAIGSIYKNNNFYAQKYANLSTLSFHPVKTITTGEGGAVFTNNKSLIEKINLYKNHGLIREKYIKNQNTWPYSMHDIGFNFRLSDINCALGISQMKKLDYFLSKRKKIADFYNNFFESHKNIIHTQFTEYNYKNSYHLYSIRVKFSKLNVTKAQLFKKMLQNNIALQVHYRPIHTQPYYKKKYKLKNSQFPEAMKFYEEQISLPIYPELSISKAKFVANKLINILYEKP